MDAKKGFSSIMKNLLMEFLWFYLWNYCIIIKLKIDWNDFEKNPILASPGQKGQTVIFQFYIGS